MYKGVVYDWRPGDKRGHMFATGVADEDVVEEESEEEESRPEEHCVVLGRVDYRGHFSVNEDLLGWDKLAFVLWNCVIVHK